MPSIEALASCCHDNDEIVVSVISPGLELLFSTAVIGTVQPAGTLTVRG